MARLTTEVLAELLIQGLEDYNQSVRLNGSDHLGTEEFMHSSSHSTIKQSLGMILPSVQVFLR